MKILIDYEYDDIKKSKYFELLQKYESVIRKSVQECLKSEGLEYSQFQIYLKYTTERKIRKINNEYRKIDKATDVLSFPMYEKKDLKKEIKQNEESSIPIHIGDIVICVKRIEEQSVEYGHSFKRELIYLTVHAMFHLLGYDHMIAKDKKSMRKKEDEVMEILKISR